MTKKIKMNIWSRDFELPIEYDCYDDEKVTKEQINALKNFQKHKEWIDHSKPHVEEYCKEKVMADDDNVKKDNIFSYVIPKYLYVDREEPEPRVSIMCNYRYDMEHGLAVVFSAEGDVLVGMQDIVL